MRNCSSCRVSTEFFCFSVLSRDVGCFETDVSELPIRPIFKSQAVLTFRACLCPEPDRSSPCPHPTSWRFILLLSSRLRLGLASGRLGRTDVSVRFRVFCVWFITWLSYSGEELLAPRPTPKLKDHPLSAVSDCLLSIFAATLHIWTRTDLSRVIFCNLSQEYFRLHTK